MNDTSVSFAQDGSACRWLLLVHQLPVEPAYTRVKVRRRLARLGAVLLKNSVYALPNTPEHLEDLVWLANEILADGGEATICAASLLFGLTDDDLLAQFPELQARESEGEPTGMELARPRGATWVTRKGVFVDRIASAWLIRRFIDPDATFRFAAGERARRAAGEFRFDMFEGEFTHVGDQCTFEVLLDRFGIADQALQAIAEIVHDIDLKDDRFGRPEAAGVRAMIAGIAEETRDDNERIARGSSLFDALYRSIDRG
jgi:hypothetical protein